MPILFLSPSSVAWTSRNKYCIHSLPTAYACLQSVRPSVCRLSGPLFIWSYRLSVRRSVDQPAGRPTGRLPACMLACCLPACLLPVLLTSYTRSRQSQPHTPNAPLCSNPTSTCSRHTYCWHHRREKQSIMGCNGNRYFTEGVLLGLTVFDHYQ